MLKVNKIIAKTETQIVLNVTAPLYWWQDESCSVTSTIPWEEVIKSHIKGKNFVIDDFSIDDLFERSIVSLEQTIKVLNYYRLQYIEEDVASTSSREEYMQQIFKLLPNCYNLTGNISLSMITFNFLKRWFKDSSYKEWSVFIKCIQEQIE